MSDEVKTCVLCGKPFVGWGNNPEPLARWEAGRCCDDCNRDKVLMERLRRVLDADES